MSLTIFEPIVLEQESNENSNEMLHWVCCNEYQGLCGTDLVGEDVTDDDEPADCVVCQDLYDIDAPCLEPSCPLRAVW